MSKVEVQDLLTHHWAMDEMAAEALAAQIERFGGQEQLNTVVADLDQDIINFRDQSRKTAANIFTRRTKKKMVILGECSVDHQTDYDELFENIENVAAEIKMVDPEVEAGVRINAAKPRTKGGWTGLSHSLDIAQRAILPSIFKKALKLNLATFSEITNVTQLGSIAPYLTGPWAGTRDMQSTAIRNGFTVYHLPSLLKNSQDGSRETIQNAANEDSGVDIGNIARTAYHPGISAQILPVGEGNQNVGIIARGRNLTDVEKSMSSDRRRQLALEHLSSMCVAGSEQSAGLFIDGSHDVPAMFDVERDSPSDPKNPNRLVKVLSEINHAIETGDIQDAQQIVGFIGEVGLKHGRTDPNYLIDTPAGKAVLSALLGRTVVLIS
jgi:phospho-2-dehydro-3-deoxyheptonate aldolase